MILRRLHLKNFRQYRGEHQVEFAPPGSKPLTLIMGFNTFGKSTLLNAINFALYGDVQEDFSEKDRLLNSDCERERDYSLEVGLEFEFQTEIFKVTRKRTYTFHAGGKAVPTDSSHLYMVDRKTGEQKELSSVQQLINRAMPQQMSNNFIFHGEKRANAYAGANTRREVGQAIRQILGCQVIETTIGDLKKFEKRIEATLAKDSGDQEIELLQKHIESLERKSQDEEEKLANKDDQIIEVKAEIARLDELLRNHQQTEFLQKQLDSARAKKAVIEESLSTFNSELATWIRRYSAEIVGGAAAHKALNAVDEEEYKGKIPSDYKESFIKDLLARGSCICGHKIAEGSSEYTQVRSLLADAGKKDIIDAVLKVRTNSEVFIRQNSTARDSLRSIQKNKIRLDRELIQLESEIREHETKLGDVDTTDLKEKAAKRKALSKRQEELILQKGDLDRKHRVETLPGLKEKQELFERLTAKRPETQRKRLLLSIARALKQKLELELASYESQAREEILLTTNSNLEIMHRSKEAFFDEKFNLGLRDRLSGLQGALSTGESQLLVLAFTAALIQFCAKRERDSNLLLVPGTVAPLILDAPFGQLDSVFQGGAISWIPRMAKQVILLVSDTQGALLLANPEAVSKIGSAYVIQLQQGTVSNPGPYYEISGHRYPSKIQSPDLVTTVLKKVL